MLNTIADYFKITCFVLGTVTVVLIAVFLGLMIMVPVLIYCTYHMFRVYRKHREVITKIKEEPSHDQDH